MSLLVGTGGTHIGELLGLRNVHNQVILMDMLANHLTGIDFLTRIDEELTAILQLVDGISIGSTRLHSNHRTVGTTDDLALIRLILLEAVSHNSLALRSGQHIGTQTDDTT